ncbi:hypothetical protein ON010_g15023 [Phytophthora cinnamomi]|nr:hypothetical protein ON010_g15023 [Phytophthora cinnamomi]
MLKKGWARRPKRGELYGAKYVSLYEQRIEDIFREGQQEKSTKLGPACMLEALVGIYSHRLNLPGENEILGLITQIMRRRRGTNPQSSVDQALPPQLFEDDVHAGNPSVPQMGSAQNQLIAPGNRRRQRKEKMDPAHAKFIDEVVIENSKIMAKQPLTCFCEHFPKYAGKVDAEQICSKVSYLKRESKRSRN